MRGRDHVVDNVGSICMVVRWFTCLVCVEYWERPICGIW